MTYRVAAILTTLSDLQGHSPSANLSNVIFRNTVQKLTKFQLT